MARIDQVEPATREVVAVVLDHELVGGPSPAPLERLEHRDAPVVERADREDRLGDRRRIGFVLGDDAHGERGRSGRRGVDRGRPHDDLDDVADPPKRVTFGRVTVVQAAVRPAGMMV